MAAKKTTVEKRSCNQCGSQMLVVRFDYRAILQSDACIKPDCPNYGLLQLPAEDLNECLKVLKVKKKTKKTKTTQHWIWEGKK